MRIIKWTLIIGLAIVLLLLAALGIGSRLALDQSQSYTRAASALPAFDKTSNGIVLIDTDKGPFRARVRNLDGEGETVILLHGFPVTSAMWEPLLDPLAASGYRVVAFDQRGYSPGVRPEDAAEYAIDQLVADVLRIADRVGAERFHLAGHDWGAAVGWTTVMAHPQRIRSWTGLSIAHPAAFTDAVANDPDQRSRSSYFALFATPWLPEALMSFNSFAMLRDVYTPMPDTALDEYLALFSEPGALTAALNWYRQMAAGGVEPTSPAIDTPTLFIWGNDDPSAGRVAVDGQAAYMQGPYKRFELNGGHWLMETHANAIVPMVIAHIAEFSGGP